MFAATRRSLQVGTSVLLLVLGLVPALAGGASGQSASGPQARLSALQEEWNAKAAQIEELYSRRDVLSGKLKETRKQIARVSKKAAKLQAKVAERATALYKAGSTGAFEILLNSNNITELTDQAVIMSRVSLDDTTVFVSFRRAQQRLTQLRDRLKADQEEVEKTAASLEKEVEQLEAEFESASALFQQVSAPVATAPAKLKNTDGMYCPVAGPNSFTDTYGAPRSGGRSHQGVDMLAARGTPQVAIVSGTITYASYSSLGGYIQYLSGDDGHLYVYVHQDRNIVTGGRVKAGQTISTVGDTGNAAGTPHLHFEYHPGGGAAVNPTPLVASIC